MLIAYRGFYNIDIVIQVVHSSTVPIAGIVGYTVVAIFSPIAGLLADLRFSRYRAVTCSSYAIIFKNVFMFLGMVTYGLLVGYKSEIFYSTSRNTAGLMAVFILVGIFVIVYVVFIINAFQFGMDQLQDLPTEDFILFIHWYVWSYYTCSLVTEITWNLLLYDYYYFDYLDRLRISGLCLLALVCVSGYFLLIISLCIFNKRKVLFLLEPAGVNPYKLVYKITKFACQHKVPLRRSAFTYCTEEVPSRMDVGKRKYGGPFTTKQVEDVKAFWGILKVVLSIGPACLLQTVTQSLLPAFAKHGNVFLLHTNSTVHHEIHLEGVARHIIVSNGLLSPMLVVICIPVYLCWIRPHVRYWVPGALKRMGFAIILMIFSLSSTFAIDLLVHARKTESANCMFSMYVLSDYSDYITDFSEAPPLYQNVYFFTFQHVLSALVNMLLDIAVLEFICSQSPYSMKGLLLGTFFSTKSLFQGIAVSCIFPFGLAWKIQSLSCGSGFYLMNIIIALASLLLYIYAAKRYKYREVNEPSHEYRYAEEYYSNIRS